MREGTASRVTAADRPYGEFYDFYSVSPENFGSILVLLPTTPFNLETVWAPPIRLLGAITHNTIMCNIWKHDSKLVGHCHWVCRMVKSHMLRKYRRQLVVKVCSVSILQCS